MHISMCLVVLLFTMQPASPKAVQAVLATLESEHISATVRREMGSDIGGACGQLRRRHLENNG